MKRGVGNKPMLPPDGIVSGQDWRMQDALYLGKFRAQSIDEAMNVAFIEETKIEPKEHMRTEAREWKLGHPESSIWRAHALDLKDGGSSFAVYFSFWVYTPRSISMDDQVTILLLVAGKGGVFVNGKPLAAGEGKTGQDLRTFIPFDRVEFRKGWNHILVKLAGGEQDIENVQQRASLIFFMKFADLGTARDMITAVSILPAEGDSSTLLK